MTNVGEGVAVPQSSQATTNEAQEDRHGCEWKDCPNKDAAAPKRTHANSFSYPMGSDLARRPLTLSDVDTEEQEKFTKPDGTTYPSAIHHLVPISAFEGPFPDLQKNAELAGYKINEKINLMALPRIKDDAKALGLQYHAGGHGLTKKSMGKSKEVGNWAFSNTNYKDFIARRLTFTEKESLKKCAQDTDGTGKPQSDWLKRRLDLDSNRIRAMIRSRKILLVK